MATDPNPPRPIGPAPQKQMPKKARAGFVGKAAIRTAQRGAITSGLGGGFNYDKGVWRTKKGSTVGYGQHEDSPITASPSSTLSAYARQRRRAGAKGY